MRINAAIRAMLATTLSGSVLLLAACDQNPPAPEMTGEASGEATEAVVSEPAPLPTVDASAAASAGIAAGLDMAALVERRDPERLLRYYTNALRVGDWIDAARAWSLDAQMTPEKLQAEFGGQASPKIAVGKGDTEGAAGSLYYEAPIVVDFADGRPSKRGTIVLRRVNDVPGASEEQLNWRIERTSTLIPQ
ncbi:hypothetical protein [Novosphingobium mangrovi (ex Huang et al. 2023)]|uniref:Lipoprotein n=1 Tax=Novosphingobium mangrovi (ex Huang et al. 2023) TaxID=2976432 RepID=A0ABT2I0N9_9SPHN|nr:hypothetical protein [Novosphingobium mangrovi (ex Huang et al. 2023)]MCT2398372.1 hypothetical protein [Novosphingobium mangrovi (ex Huang et al. 2023)]